MNLKGIFANRSASFQIFLLLSLVLVGTLLAGIVSLIPVQLEFNNNSPGVLRLYQFISATLAFLLPSLVAAYLFSYQPFEYLSLKKKLTLKTALLTFFSMFLLSPIITLTGLLNKAMKLPAFMEKVEKWMQDMEASAERVTEVILSGTDFFSILMNLFVVAVMAAITEEFLFRGTLQRIISKWTIKPHKVIWITAIIFSAVHMQFYGFIPRLLLGAYFGYLIYWSNNMWLPVLAHFTNNAVAVIGMSSEKLKDQVFITGDIPESEIVSFTIPALISFCLFILCVKYLRESLKPAKDSFS